MTIRGYIPAQGTSGLAARVKGKRVLKTKIKHEKAESGMRGEAHRTEISKPESLLFPFTQLPALGLSQTTKLVPGIMGMGGPWVEKLKRPNFASQKRECLRFCAWASQLYLVLALR